ncbi:unnamed protein product [Cylicocyclus nassatus]|uniref:AP3A hydrolase n=1 Tax=Cylicocyclus nassatus TaxID=53992 RepID=A0AA36H201_CYLNA|nr:unnamed protein product [Cylicocyclus nassatus]
MHSHRHMNPAVLYLLYFFVVSVSPLSEHPKLIIISFDGFRHDKLDPRLVPNLAKWASLGVQFTNGLTSQYPSFTAVNHMSISTGLFTESHGIVSNVFYDRALSKIYDYWNETKIPGIIKESIDGLWYRGEPIWVTNERDGPGRRSASLYWPYGEVPFPTNPSRPSIYRNWVDFRPLEEWKSDADEIVRLFTDAYSPVNFVSWYIAEPDHCLHTHGYHDGHYKEMMRKLDTLFDYFLRRMKASGLEDKVNIIFTADHGHIQVNGVDNVLCVEDYVDMNRIRWAFNMIYAEDRKHADQMYTSLSQAVKENHLKVKIFRKENFDDRWHFTGISSRIGDIILEPEAGYDVQFNCGYVKEAKKQSRDLHSSTHGINPDDPGMRAVLVLRGPSFAKTQKITRIPQNIDLYPLMCYLLGIKPAPNNGSMVVFQTTVEFTEKQRRFYHGFTIIVVPLVGMIVLLIVVAATQCCKGLCISERAISEQSGRSAASIELGEKHKAEEERGSSSQEIKSP